MSADDDLRLVIDNVTSDNGILSLPIEYYNVCI